MLLVGDSVATNALGYPNELPVTMEEMLHHTRAVVRGVEQAMVVGDMPFLSYQVSAEEGIRNAGRFLKEGGAHAVKLEGPQVELTHRLVELGIPVMAHLGLTPQSVHGLGGYRVQGRGEEAARAPPGAGARDGEGRRVRDRARGDARRARRARSRGELQIPTIGIGAGPDCDAQVLVINDLLGLTEHPPKFAKAYADLRGTITDAVRRSSPTWRPAFPDADHTYS